MSVFRKQYRELAALEKQLVDDIKNKADELYRLIDSATVLEPRSIALAKTKLEEAVMWAVKGITQ